VGPDNGLLGPAAKAIGVTAAVRLTSQEHRRHPVSPTFHGRDVFAPAAAHLAGGGALEDLGEPVDADSLHMPDLPPARPTGGRLAALAVGVDRFGNVALLATPADLEAAGLTEGDKVRVVVAGGSHPGRVGRVFADVAAGNLLVHVDSSGMVALAVNRASAAERLGLGAAGWVVVERALG
jgi:S-adenosylmethionine hydrolase